MVDSIFYKGHKKAVAVIDEKIDDIIYGLYGITEEEKKTIESNQ